MQQAGATLGCDPGLLAGVAPLVSWSAALALTGSVVAVPVLESTGSAVVTHGLGALRPVGSSQTRVEPTSPALGGGVLTMEPPGGPRATLLPHLPGHAPGLLLCWPSVLG